MKTAATLLRHGWRVKALARNSAKTTAKNAQAGIEWVQGDAMDQNSVIESARGATLIVHAVNPAGYRNWGGVVLPMIDNSIAAARASGARILLPGTIYNYGPDAFPVLTGTPPSIPSRARAPSVSNWSDD